MQIFIYINRLLYFVSNSDIFSSKSEIRSIKTKKKSKVKSKRNLFNEQGNFSKNNRGVSKKNKLNEESIKRLNKANIPRSIINRINKGNELTDVENEILHRENLEVVTSSKRSSFVREYKGGTPNRMRNLNLANEKRGL